MQGWRIVVIYTADREKKLTAESFFQIRYITNFNAGAAQGKRMCVVVCDAAHVTCKECPVLFYGTGKPGGTAEIVSSQDFCPGTFFTIKT